MEQKYKSAYYTWVDNAHYCMFEGIRSRHESRDEACRVCEVINKQHNLPNVNVYKSASFGRQTAQNAL